MKQIEGYEDYMIDEDGNVYSNKSGQVKKLKLKKTRGYLYASLFKNKKQKTCYIHRLLYQTFVGNIPEGIEVDHIDRDKTNNKLNNLRLVTRQQNNFNTTAKGYTWNKVAKKWEAQIMLDRKKIFLGFFNTESEARAAYLAAKEKLHII